LRKDGFRVEQSDSVEIPLCARTAMEYLHSPVSQALVETGQKLQRASSSPFQSSCPCTGPAINLLPSLIT
jgi:hypothetical protein